MAGASVSVKRIYDDPEPGDGTRVLVDRLWPRGLSKEKAQLDLWAREVAPSDELRRWFHANREEWDELRRRYREELEGRRRELEPLLERVRQGKVTLLYSSRDRERNNAVVLKEYLQQLRE